VSYNSTMLDPTYVRDNQEEVKRALVNRGMYVAEELAKLTDLENRRRRLIPELEGLKRDQNAAGEEVARAKRQGVDASGIFEVNRQRSRRIKELGVELEEVEQQRTLLLMSLPNIPHASVPIGKSEADNVVVRTWGKQTPFDFEPVPHWDLGPALGILDFERATKMSGARFALLLGAGARLSRALTDFMLDLHTREHGYLEAAPPYLVNRASLEATGQLPKFEADLFKVAGDWDLFLIPTAEVPLTNIHRNEMLNGDVLPLKYVAYTPCYRSEAGSYGKDVRGLIRQHQFEKVEMVKITHPDASYDELESMTLNAEEVLKRLGLPYRTVVLSTGDLGPSMAKTYDVEVWLPGQQTYKEISSCSNAEAFQARRANIKFKAGGTGKPEFVHTLNGSGLPIGRTLVAVLENYQQKDGSVRVPDALRPYMGGLAVIEPRQP
jgi:seryl-tRNA synthetase